MSYDLKIIGGTIIDGTGAVGFAGDVAVKAGRIVAVGECPDDAKETLSAEGAIVTPGFVDVHTHYDGQISWDSDMAPSSIHGVTTCLMGSCGVGFAPVRPQDHERLIELMEGVEDIPGSALAEGLTWNWESFEQYMDAIDAIEHSIDFAAMVPHDPLRVYVMGERAVADGVASDDDIAGMQQHLRSALSAGALGFSTGRTDNHRTAKGAATPASEAHIRELTGLAGAFKGLGHGVLQAVSDFDMAAGDEHFDAEFDVIEKMAEAADGHSLSISLMQRDASPKQWERIIERAERADARGLSMRLQVAPRAIGVMLGLEATFHPFMGFPSYKKIAHLPLAERVKALRDPELKRRLLAEKSEKVAGDGSPIPPLADQLLAQIDMVSLRLFDLGETPNYEPVVDDALYFRAQQQNVPPLEAIYDALLEQDGRALLYFPLYNYTEMSLDNVQRMLAHPLSLPGLSDGGAHVGTVCDASFSTFALMHWARDRKTGRFSLEHMVRRQSSDTAKYLGLTDRGVLAPGKKADINVIDFDNLGLLPPRMVRDLPAGGQRLLQKARGYRATFVSGHKIVADDELTGARPGRLVRGGR
ncbi:MAG TPA: amidohydrolase family protein [Polyangiaceae bacterium]|nr:amidohydrolase family protein [Polyangiaceae bacterium]